MKYLRIVFLFSLALIILTGCEKEQVQPDTLQASEEAALKSIKALSDAECIELHGTFHIYVGGIIKNMGPKILRSLGEGNLIHLGKTDVKLIQAWLPIPGTGIPTIPPWKGQGWSTVNPDDGTEKHVTFYTKHGEIYAEYGSKPDFPWQPLPEYLDGNAISYHKTEYHVTVSFTGRVTGGTGIFENATGGEFSWDVIYNPATNKGVAKIRGQVVL